MKKKLPVSNLKELKKYLKENNLPFDLSSLSDDTNISECYLEDSDPDDPVLNVTYTKQLGRK